MGNCALVTDSFDKKGIKKRLEKKLRIFRHNYGYLEKINLTDKYMLYVIHLIYTKEELKNLSNGKIIKIQKFIYELCSQSNIVGCVFSNDISHKFSLQDSLKKSYSGTFLYKSSIMNIIHKYCLCGTQIYSDLRVLIVLGSDFYQLMPIVDILSEKIKFLTVTTNSIEHMQSIRQQLDDKLYQSGICVAVTNQYEHSLWDYDIIINLGILSKLDFTGQAKKACTIINYNTLKDVPKFKNVRILNKIDIKLFKHISAKLSSQLLNNFTPIQIVETILIHSFEIELDTADEKFTAATMKKLAKEVNELGYIR